MKDEHELFELMKANYTLKPRAEFVSVTSNKLRQEARKLDKKRKYKRLSVIATSMALCFMAISWFFLLGGQEAISVAISAVGQSKLVPAASEQEPSIYIYHTYNRDSFIPELNLKDASKVLDETKNITLVGKRLKDALLEENIHAIHETTDFEGELEKKGLLKTDSYILSRESIKKILMSNKNIKMLIDIHRDSTPRKDSTIMLNGKKHAKVALFLSISSKNHKANLAFAKQIHNKMEQKYPGLSEGIILKDSGMKSADYNQDLMDNSVLLSIGGVDNALEEEYRTADILAGILKEIIEEE
ncbi:stage II sporulation protein P [Psychrobacillus sp. NPDC096389]|uniref:stage II sporulation protein P n=1 Tax=Psychrobacillus sp. NPDC096389 TaxID=3364490 RepID=UPI0038100706